VNLCLGQSSHTRCQALAATALIGVCRRRGYNTEAEREAATKLAGVRSITLGQFNELVKFGILMGVDDGCQDEE
jgi:ketol-acid reductoisomerase